MTLILYINGGDFFLNFNFCKERHLSKSQFWSKRSPLKRKKTVEQTQCPSVRAYP